MGEGEKGMQGTNARKQGAIDTRKSQPEIEMFRGLRVGDGWLKAKDGWSVELERGPATSELF